VGLGISTKGGGMTTYIVAYAGAVLLFGIGLCFVFLAGRCWQHVDGRTGSAVCMLLAVSMLWGSLFSLPAATCQ